MRSMEEEMSHSHHSSPRASFEFLFDPEHATLESQNDIVFFGKQIKLLDAATPTAADDHPHLNIFHSASAPLLGTTTTRTKLPNNADPVKRVNSSPASFEVFLRYRSSSWRHKQRVPSFRGLAPKMDIRMELDDLKRRQLRKNNPPPEKLADRRGGGMLRCGARFAGALAMRVSLALSCISPA